MPVQIEKTIKVEMLMDTRTLSKTYSAGDIVGIDYVTALRWTKHAICTVTDQNAEVTAVSPLPTDLWAKEGTAIGVSEQEEKLREFIKNQEGEEGLQEILQKSEEMKAEGDRGKRAEQAAGEMTTSVQAENLKKARAAKEAKKSAEDKK